MEEKRGETGGGGGGGGRGRGGSGGTRGSTGPRTPISRRRICAELPRPPPMCASPQRGSLSPRDCATAPQQRFHSTRGVSPPRSDIKSAKRSKNESVGIPPYEVEGPVSNKDVPGTSLRRRLDFAETSNGPSEIKNNTKTKSYHNAKIMNSSPEALESNALSGHKRPWLRSSGCVLGTFSIDLANETVTSTKKNPSTRAQELVNSREKDNEPGRLQLKDKAATIAGCSATCVNHKIFLCPRELGRSTGIDGYSILEKRMLPGGHEEVDFLVRKAKKSFNRMIKCVTTAHKMGICFNGNLSKHNFRVTEEASVKITGAEPSKFSKAGAKLDDRKLADIIEEFFAGLNMPPSVAELLRLLREAELRQEDSMSNNISLKTELQRMSLSEWMLKTVETLEKTDTTTAYTEIMDTLEKAYIKHWDKWQTSAVTNEHLCKIFEYVDPVTGKGSVYPKTLKGLLRFVRNCIEHLPKHSYDPATRESLCYLFEIDHVISGTYQGLFEILQSVLSAAGKACNW